MFQCFNGHLLKLINNNNNLWIVEISTVTMMFKAVHNLNCLTLPVSVNLVHSGTQSNHPYKFRHIFAHSNAYKFSFFPGT